MPTLGKTLGSVESRSNGNPLPLFRPEAVAALQQKFYGEIILVRPFPLMLLCWFALGITTAVLGFLFLGQYTERTHVPGVIVNSGTGLSTPEARLRAEVYVPARLLGRLQTGTQLSVRCDSCAAQFARQIGTILEVPQSPLDSAELAQNNLRLTVPVYRIALALASPVAQTTQLNLSPQAGARVEVEIPLGKKPLIKWFFERSGS